VQWHSPDARSPRRLARWLPSKSPRWPMHQGAFSFTIGWAACWAIRVCCTASPGSGVRGFRGHLRGPERVLHHRLADRLWRTGGEKPRGIGFWPENHPIVRSAPGAGGCLGSLRARRPGGAGLGSPCPGSSLPPIPETPGLASACDWPVSAERRPGSSLLRAVLQSRSSLWLHGVYRVEGRSGLFRRQ
jgi:hypothetical protein